MKIIATPEQIAARDQLLALCPHVTIDADMTQDELWKRAAEAWYLERDTFGIYADGCNYFKSAGFADGERVNLFNRCLTEMGNMFLCMAIFSPIVIWR